MRPLLVVASLGLLSGCHPDAPFERQRVRDGESHEDGGENASGGRARDAGLALDASQALPSPGDVLAPDRCPGHVAPAPPMRDFDIVLVVDNSTGMADKQVLFENTVPDLVDMLVNPPCIDGVDSEDPLDDTIVEVDASGRCPEGSDHAFPSAQSLRAAVITSSMGAHGLDDPELCPDVPMQNDRAHLLPQQRVETHPQLLSETGYESGYLAWAPYPFDGVETDPSEFTRKLSAQLAAVGEAGCPFEAPLEAAYRFLVDPAPFESLDRVSCSAGGTDTDCVAPSGTDSELLSQRQNFLRSDSYLIVIYLSDENDCSIKDSGMGYYALRSDPMERGTAACDLDPNDRCCQSCRVTLRDGCDADPSSNGCEPILSPLEETEGQLAEAFGLRCFDQKRRFGMDFLYGTDRYVAGFTSSEIVWRDNSTVVDNPLFANGRSPEHVTVVAIVGAPWQDLTRDVTDPTGALLPASALDWSLLLPSEASEQPLDPFNIESMEVREGTHPITGDVLGGPLTHNPINGFDRDLVSGDGRADDLQHACSFELAEPRDCVAPGANSDCPCAETEDASDAGVSSAHPLCEGQDSTTGTVQYRAGAYPAPRILELVRGMGERGVLGSICPRNALDPERPDYAYLPLMRSLIQALR